LLVLKDISTHLMNVNYISLQIFNQLEQINTIIVDKKYIGVLYSMSNCKTVFISVVYSCVYYSQKVFCFMNVKFINCKYVPYIYKKKIIVFCIYSIYGCLVFFNSIKTIKKCLIVQNSTVKLLTKNI